MNNKITNSNDLSNKIRQLRIRNDLSQQQISDILKCNRVEYSLWENNKRTIPLEYLNRISNKFNINIDYLVGLNNKKNIEFKVKEINKKELGKNIRIARKEMRITQKELANKLNVTKSLISAYETGKTNIPTLFLVEIAKIIDKSLNHLLGKIED